MLKSCLISACPRKIDPMIVLIQERAKAPDFLGNIKVLSTMTVPAGSWSQTKSKVKILMDNDEQTIHFYSENYGKCR